MIQNFQIIWKLSICTFRITFKYKLNHYWSNSIIYDNMRVDCIIHFWNHWCNTLLHNYITFNLKYASQKGSPSSGWSGLSCQVSIKKMARSQIGANPLILEPMLTLDVLAPQCIHRCVSWVQFRSSSVQGTVTTADRSHWSIYRSHPRPLGLVFTWVYRSDRSLRSHKIASFKGKHLLGAVLF